ncbi:MAG TPA: glycosyltransferase family 4 protein [Bacteroidia bacterium]|nr:glycosyltransferase family 4 protein [Bacteroidia bacterium]
MKKALIITYYWPPSGGSGVQRWLKFVKYMREFGWEPIVYTPSNSEMPVIDASLEKDIPKNIVVLKQPIWEPYSIYKMFIGQKKSQKINAAFLSENEKSKYSEKFSVWLRGNFFIPDARKFWVKPSVKYLSDYLKKNPVHIIVSSGPPHSMHLIAMQLKNKFNIPWIADFRDPWTNIDFYQDLMLRSFADKKHKRLELEVLKNADSVISVGKTMSEEFEKIIFDAKIKSENKNKFRVITNGFDSDDVSSEKIMLDKKFSIAHIGTMAKSRNPKAFWKVLGELIQENKTFENDLEIKLVGKIDISILKNIELFKLEKQLKKIDYLSHNEIVKVQQQSQILLLVLNNTHNAKSILTGKMFEYLSAQRPILCIGPKDGDAAQIIEETQSGVTINFEDEVALKKIILIYYDLFKKNQLQTANTHIEKYSRKNLTKNLCEMMDEVVSSKK